MRSCRRRGGGPVPLVVDMRLWRCADAHARYSGWRAIAELGGAVVAWPQGSRTADGFPSWGAGRASDPANKFPVDGVGFLRELVARVLADGAGGVADPARVIMAGHSNGCMMAQRVALDASSSSPPSAAARATCSSRPARPRRPGYSPVPVVTVHGTLDPTVPYSSANVEHWARINGCSAERAVDGGDALRARRRRQPLRGAHHARRRRPLARRRRARTRLGDGARAPPRRGAAADAAAAAAVGGGPRLGRRRRRCRRRRRPTPACRSTCSSASSPPRSPRLCCSPSLSAGGCAERAVGGGEWTCKVWRRSFLGSPHHAPTPKVQINAQRSQTKHQKVSRPSPSHPAPKLRCASTRSARWWASSSSSRP